MMKLAIKLICILRLKRRNKPEKIDLRFVKRDFSDIKSPDTERKVKELTNLSPNNDLIMSSKKRLYIPPKDPRAKDQFFDYELENLYNISINKNSSLNEFKLMSPKSNNPETPLFNNRSAASIEINDLDASQNSEMSRQKKK